MFFLRTYNIFTGAIISFLIALLAFVPRPLHEGYLPATGHAFVSFSYCFCCWLVIQFFLRHRGLRKTWVKAVWALACCIALSVAATYVSRANNWELPGLLARNGSDRQQLRTTIARVLVANGLLFFISYLLYLSAEAQRTKLENERMKHENLQARLFSLQQQISPHFLFNSLNTLRSIAPDKATKHYVQQLAQVYRYVLTTHVTNLTTLEAELHFMQAYLHLLKERFEDAVQIHVSVDEALLTTKLPPVTLQILVENAIKHNVVSSDMPLSITITTPNRETLAVENLRQMKLSVEEGTGTGLQNIQDRYLLLAGKSIHVEQTTTYFRVQIPLLS